jgi:hypothetical protein
MTVEPPQLPIIIITGANWTMEIPLDEYNAQFNLEAQMMEASSRAIETLKGQRDEELHVVMNPDSKEEAPTIGMTILAHLKGTNPEEAKVIFTHVCLANMGMYNESMKMEALLTKQIAELREKAQSKQKEQEKHEADLKMFDNLKKDFVGKKTRKLRKPKDDDSI